MIMSGLNQEIENPASALESSEVEGPRGGSADSGDIFRQVSRLVVVSDHNFPLSSSPQRKSNLM